METISNIMYMILNTKNQLNQRKQGIKYLVFDEAVIDNDKAYLFLCDKTNDEQGFTYNGYIYDFKSKKLNIFEDKESVSFPCFLE